MSQTLSSALVAEMYINEQAGCLEEVSQIAQESRLLSLLFNVASSYQEVESNSPLLELGEM